MAVTDRYKKTEDLPAAIPVFPLQGCILLPRATLPLNVFEPRYLRMIDDILSGARLVGIIQPATEAGEVELPTGRAVPLRRIGCAGRLTAFEELPDGRMTIMLTGVCRFEIESEIVAAAPYRRMQVAWRRFAPDLERGAGEEDIDRVELMDGLKTYLEAKRLQVDWSAIERSGCEPLVNALSIISPYGPEEKQALLEATTLQQRAGVLLALAQMELAGGPSGETRRRLQ